jgi:hypothetical protein
MDVEIKKISVPESPLLGEEGTITEKDQPSAVENLPTIASVSGDIGQFSAKETLCPETALNDRITSVSYEPPAEVDILAYVNSEEVQRCIDLTLDIITCPEKVENFKFEDRQLSKKEAEAKLAQVLENFKGKITTENRCNVKPIKNMVKQAFKIVHEKLHKEKLHKAAKTAIKAAKIGGAALAAGAAIATTAITFGASSPVTIPMAASAIASIVDTMAESGKTVLETLKKE